MSFFAALPVISRVAFSNPVQLALLTNLLGGYVWARYWHFLVMVALVTLSVVHVIMVFAVDPYSLRSMITGGYNETKSPEARNARPFFWRRPAAKSQPDGRPAA
jgi:thiosulfate reductase cytochrome b subunit